METPRKERCTEMELPPDLDFETQASMVDSLLRKAYRYSDVPLPKGVTEGEL